MAIARNIETELLRWKKLGKRKPVILRGARQVGKTFAVNRFSRHYAHFLELNLERPRERGLFENFNTGRELVERILLYKGVAAVDKKNTLLFIDEIQNSAEAIKALRYLYEDDDEISVVAAGSLLEVFSWRQGFSFPVGRVKNMFMYPVNFMEYLKTKNPPLAGKLSRMDLLEDNTLHELLIEQFNEYAFVGGMPEALSAYMETDSYSAAREIHDAIYMGYLEDVEKYSNLAKAKYLTHTIDRAPLYAGERIVYEKFGESSYRSREMREAFDTIERALIIHRARPSASTRIPVVEKMRKAPKLFFLDAGLANHRIGFREFFSNAAALDNVYQGKIAEQIVAQEIVSQTFAPPSLNFWVRDKGVAETDFLYLFGEHVIPIEVKSGKAGKLRSLNMFMEKCGHPYAVRIYSGKSRIDPIRLQSGKRFYLYSMPYYHVSRLDEAIGQFMERVGTEGE